MNSYVIGADDVLSDQRLEGARRYADPVTLRSDGKISLPLVGELQAGGQNPRQLEQRLRVV